MPAGRCSGSWKGIAVPGMLDGTEFDPPHASVLLPGTSDSKGTIDVLTTVNVQHLKEIRKVHYTTSLSYYSSSLLVSVPHLAHYFEGGIVNLHFARLALWPSNPSLFRVLASSHF